MKYLWPALWAGVLCAAVAQASPRVEVQALMKGSALLRIDQEQRLLRTGETSVEGVRLLSATPREAVVEIDGRRSTLTLSSRIAGGFDAPEHVEVQIARSANLQYITTASINGHRIPVLVDTGANSVAMNSADARRLGIDYLRGAPVRIRTASDVVRGYVVTIDKIVIGNITASYVEATVTEGDFPQRILLGTTFLQHVGMREENGVLYLRQKY